MAYVRKLWILVIGWLLLIAGVVLMPLPGPGMLILVSGLIVLAQEYEWAESRLEPVKQKAMEAAAQGVQSWWRILVSALGGLSLIAIGAFWWSDPTIPVWWKIGPDLPFGGWSVGSSLILSGLIALGLLVYSIRRWRYGRDSSRVDQSVR